MKTRLLSTLAALMLPLATLAQTPAALPNGNFEAWEMRNDVEAPIGWITTDDIASLLGFPPLLIPRTVTKSADAHGGSFAAKAQNVSNSLLTAPGALLLGSISQEGINLGIPYTSRPARLQFWYKLTGPSVAADSALAVVSLSNKSDSVAFAVRILDAQPTYTLADLPLRYRSSLQPDTLTIAFSAGNADNASTTSVLFIDDVQLVGTVTGTRAPVAAAALQVYPNPSATGEFSLASLTDAALATAPLTVTDATGRLVLRQAAAPVSESRGRLVDLRSQRPGVYLLRLEAPAGTVVRKLVVQ